MEGETPAQTLQTHIPRFQPLRRDLMAAADWAKSLWSAQSLSAAKASGLRTVRVLMPTQDGIG